jgi:hypothetical protein
MRQIDQLNMTRQNEETRKTEHEDARTAQYDEAKMRRQIHAGKARHSCKMRR